MTPISKGIVLFLVLLLIARTKAPAEKIAFPVKVSENKRYFVDQRGNPVFWLGTTQWQLFREYKLEEAKIILEKTASHGFAFVQVMLMGVGDGTKPNVYGQKPWINNDPLTPNEAYFKNVDAVVRTAAENNLAISMTLYHQRYRQHITMNNARRWAEWLARRYKDQPNIVWSMTPEARQEFVPVLRELAAGLHAGDGGRHLITFKPDPAPYSSSFIHAEPWLDFDAMQTWNGVRLIYPMVTKDYNLKPVKPVLMAEGAYEAGSEYGFAVTPLWVRRQAYYSYLAGGHHTYGHNDSWRVLPTWKKALDAPGAVQLGILKKILMARAEWWLLVPDQSIFASGGRTEGDVLHLAARHQDGKWAMLYLADNASFSVNMNKLAAAKVNITWVNPKTGDAVPLGSGANTGTKAFATPEGWEDALLILEASSPLRPQPGPHESPRASAAKRSTEVSIQGESFLINGKPTYAGRTCNGKRIEGLLLNARLVQGIFDDLNPETVGRWAYPDTGRWDPDRNTREFVAAMPAWRKHGLLCFTINLQGGSPQGYSKDQPWHNSAITPEGTLRPDYMARLETILDRADELGMAVILGLFYFGQDERLRDEAAVLRAVDAAVDWICDHGYRHVLVEVNNECNVRYDHAILRPERVHELIARVKERSAHTSSGTPRPRLLASTSYGGGTVPKENVVRAADFLLMHGNGVGKPERIAEMVRQCRRVPGYRPMPILFNEDDHFDFDRPQNNMLAAIGEHASWGYFDPGKSDYADGYQCPPVNWQINTPRKQAFFALVKQVTGQ